jgi:hypothetical protein
MIGKMLERIIRWLRLKQPPPIPTREPPPQVVTLRVHNIQSTMSTNYSKDK